MFIGPFKKKSSFQLLFKSGFFVFNPTSFMDDPLFPITGAARSRRAASSDSCLTALALVIDANNRRTTSVQFSSEVFPAQENRIRVCSAVLGVGCRPAVSVAMQPKNLLPL